MVGTRWGDVVVTDSPCREVVGHPPELLSAAAVRATIGTAVVSTGVRAAIGRTLTSATAGAAIGATIGTAIVTTGVRAAIGRTLTSATAGATVGATIGTAIGTAVLTTRVGAAVGGTFAGLVGLHVGGARGFAHGWISLGSGGASSRRPTFLCQCGPYRQSDHGVCAGQGLAIRRRSVVPGQLRR